MDQYEALEALRRTGTMGKAGAALRISQSAVSKRIAALEQLTGHNLTVRSGRRVTLTAWAEQLVSRVAPLLAQIRAELQQESSGYGGTISMGVSESILASWGAAALRQTEAKMAPLRFALHAHRGPVLIQHVLSGSYSLGIVAGEPGQLQGLEIMHLGDEPMVLVSVRDGEKTLISIEPDAGTWQAIGRRARKAGLIPDLYVESYFAAASMALAGYGRALVPAGVTRKIRMHSGVVVGAFRGLKRPVFLIGRKTLCSRPDIQALAADLRTSVARTDWGV